MNYFVFLFTLLGLAAGCAAPKYERPAHDPNTGQGQKNFMEQVLAEEAFLEESGVFYDDPKLQRYLVRVIDKLHAASGDNEFTFKVRIIEDLHLNAFALPNGTIYVHTGILARMDNEAQLAAILAHEMIHCISKHALRATQEAKSLSHRLDSSERWSSGADPVFDRFALFGAPGFRALMTGYTRKLETEADVESLEMISSAGYAAEEILKLFEHLESEIGSGKPEEHLGIKTHPMPSERMEIVGKFLESRPHIRRDGIRNEIRFLENVQGLILRNASLYLKAGRYDVAQRGVEKTLLVNGPNAEAYFLLGEICRKRGEPGDNHKARSWYEKTIALDPGNADAYKSLGLIHYKEKEWVPAKRLFETCLLLSPDHPRKAYIDGYLKKCGYEASALRERHMDISGGIEEGS